MSSNRDVFTTEIYVNGEQANEAMAELAKKVDTLTQRYDRMAEKNEKMAKSTEEARKKMEATTKELEKLTEGTKEYADTIRSRHLASFLRSKIKATSIALLDGDRGIRTRPRRE